MRYQFTNIRINNSKVYPYQYLTKMDSKKIMRMNDVGHIGYLT